MVYRDLGPRRSLDAATRRLRGQDGDEPRTAPGRRRRARTRQIQEWSRRWQWVRRAHAWDQELERRRLARTEEAIREMAERHAAVACAFLARVVERLEAMSQEDVARLSARDLLSWFVQAVSVEREARGELAASGPGQHTGTDDGPVEIAEIVVRTREDVESVLARLTQVEVLS
jgi:hypothetical protein